MHNLPTIVAIGAGNIASHLVPALHSIGCNVKQVFSRKLYKARGLAHRVNADGINSISNITPDADWYLIMVADDGIKEVINQLPILNSNSIVCHTSGATSSDILKDITKNYGSFYALQSFKKDQHLDLSILPFLLNANNIETLRTIRVIARQISENVYDVTDEDRLRYHLAAVYVNNFTNHMACIADQILSNSKLNPEVLRPIMNTTFNKIIQNNPCQVQTGPAVRKDIKLQNKHLELIQDNDHWIKIYKTISNSISNTNNKDENCK